MMRACSQRLMKRLAGRQQLPREQLLADVARDLSADDARELADLLELELGVPVGFLRVDDSLADLLAPFSMGNPLTWAFAEGALEDGTSEINYQLRLRRDARGQAPIERVHTVRELFVAWCAPQ